MTTDISNQTEGQVRIGNKQYVNQVGVRVKVRQLADDSLNVLIRTDRDILFMGKGTDLTIESAPAPEDPDDLRNTLSAMFPTVPTPAP